MADDIELLQRYAEGGSEVALAELVRQRVNFVYSVALRQTHGDAHLAADAAQAVFVALARNAGRLKTRTSIVGWLYTSAHFQATKAVRSHRRWRLREKEANAMYHSTENSGPDWERLRPVLDEAMHELNERDREVILLRFFENRTYHDLGTRLGTAENTARMRAERALDKLRQGLARRGITSTALAIGAALSQQPIVAAPAGLAASATTAALAGASGTGAIAAALAWTFMSTTKFKIGFACALLVLGAGGFLAVQKRFASIRAADLATIEARSKEVDNLRRENMRLKDEYRQLAASRIQPSPAALENPADAEKNQAGSSTADSLEGLRLILDLQKQGVVRPRQIPFIAANGKLTPLLTGLFALTPGEREVLQVAVDEARQQVGELAASNATVHRDEDGSVVIEIPPYTGGTQVYEKLLESFQQVLGPERNAPFLSLAAEQVQASLGQFGVAKQKITLSRNPSSGTGQAYKLRDERSWKDSTGNHNDSDGHPVPDLATIAEQYGPLARLFPPGF